MRATLLRFFPLVLIALLPAVAGASRIKDITTKEGLRDNQLTGIGLVTGLAGNGDKDLDMTNQTLQSLLRNMDVNVAAEAIKSKNIALVMVTADIPVNTRPGSRIDIRVTSIGDATSLQGGVLLQAPLRGADGVVYAVGQGPLAVGGFIGGEGGPGGASVQKNHTTAGLVSGGAIVEREINADVMKSDGSYNLVLTNPDLTTAVRIADAINTLFPGTAQAYNEMVVNVLVPTGFRGQAPNFMANVDRIVVNPDVPAKVIINERTGTIIATADVRISPVAISYGSLIIQITNQDEVSQPGGLVNQGETARTANQQTTVTEERNGFKILASTDPRTYPGDYPALSDLTNALNSMGVTTRDTIAILQTLKASGALHAELEIQ